MRYGCAKEAPTEDIWRSNTNSELQQATIDWLCDRAEHNVMVTFTFKSANGVGYGEAKWIFGLFVRRLRDRLLGRRSKRKIPMAPVLEDYREQLQSRGLTTDVREGTHVHCLMQLPGNPMDHMDMVREVWAGSHEKCGEPTVYCPGSDLWFLPIGSEGLRATLTGYVVKRFELDVDGLLVQYM